MEKIFRVISRLFHLLPVSVRHFLSEVLTWIWWDVLQVRKLVVHRNLRIAFRTWTREERLALGRRSIQHLSGNLWDLLLVPAADEKWAEKNVKWFGEEHLKAALAQGKGVLLLGMHMDSGDMAATCLALRGYRIHLITKRFKSKLTDWLWFALRKKPGVSYMEAHGSKTAYDVLSALKKNEIVVFVNDQQMGPPYGIKARFFGRSTGTAFGLALFALKTGAPIIPLYILRQPDWTQHVMVEAELRYDFAETLSRDEKVQALTQLVTDQIESIVRRWPESWMWVHRRWKDFY